MPAVSHVMPVASKSFRPVTRFPGCRPFIASTKLVTIASSSSCVQEAIDQVCLDWGSGFDQVCLGWGSGQPVGLRLYI
ncbi:hypothetical protein Hanom_Chr12g01176641 [Helianthus anomalus]